MTQPIKTFTHPAVVRARKEAAQECAKIAAEVSRERGTAERVRELIVARFELAPTLDARQHAQSSHQSQDQKSPASSILP